MNAVRDAEEGAAFGAGEKTSSHEKKLLLEKLIKASRFGAKVQRDLTHLYRNQLITTATTRSFVILEVSYRFGRVGRHSSFCFGPSFPRQLTVAEHVCEEWHAGRVTHSGVLTRIQGAEPKMREEFR